jgi:transcriptional regulator GlxA family with amidase domain
MNEQAFASDACLGRLKAHLERHLAEPLSAQKAASIAGIRADCFPTFFCDRVGLRFVEWVRLTRVERAKALIRGSDVAIAEVARSVGFNDLRTFERAFKAIVHVTPREYKYRVRPGGRGNA